MEGALKHRQRKPTVWLIYLPEFASFLLLSTLYLYNPISIDRPTSYAGLFVQMSDLLRQNGFIPPSTVPFYGPGGIPFAYPFLGFYMLAVAQSIGIATFPYLRFVPPLFTLASLCIFYLIVRLYSGKRLLAIMATLLAATSPVFFAYHTKSAGIVRAPALFFALLTIFAFSITLKSNKSHRYFSLSGVFLGVTIMTHLTYALFSTLSLLVIAIYHHRRNIFEMIKSLSITGFFAIVISAPWWIWSISQYGLKIFSPIFQTHGTLFFTTIITNPFNFLKSLPSLIELENPFLLGAGILSAGIFLGLNQPFLPIWWMIIAVGVGESQRFSPLFAGWLTSELFWTVIPKESLHRIDRLRWFIAGGLLLSLCMLPLLQAILKEKSSLTDSFLSLAAWLKQSTALDASFLFLNGDKSTSEWLPYLSQRTPITAPWGSEWTGQYEEQGDIFDALSGCLEIQSSGCIDRLIHEYSLTPNYLILPMDLPILFETLNASSKYEQVYQNTDFTIFYIRVEKPGFKITTALGQNLHIAEITFWTKSGLFP